MAIKKTAFRCFWMNPALSGIRCIDSQEVQHTLNCTAEWKYHVAVTSFQGGTFQSIASFPGEKSASWSEGSFHRDPL
jgi:hypothetical protein